MSRNVLGILGLGSETTTFYIRELNRLYHEKRGGYSTCPFVMLNSNFDTINTLLPNVSKKLDSIIQKYICELEMLDVAYIIIPNITLHQTVDRLKTTQKILHPLQICINTIKEKRVTLFGTKYTMKSAYIYEYFKASGIEIIIPDPTDFAFIEEFRQRIYLGQENQEMIAHFHTLIKKYASASPIVLACTELSIYNEQSDKVYDMVQLQIAKAINKIT